MSAEAFPLQWPDGWPRTPANRRKATPFRVNPGVAMAHLYNELRLLGAKNIVLSTNVPVRGDGIPYAGAMDKRYDDPGAAVYFILDNQQMSMARDLYMRPQDNVRSLGLAVEAMRAIERHGGDFMMKRAFSGFTALPAPKSPWEILGIKPNSSSDEIERAFRAKAKEAHPDAGGSDDAMAALNQARDSAYREINA